MIPNKYYSYVFSFFMALLMSCLMSFVITTFNVGLIEGLAFIWLKSWLFAFVVAFPSVLLVSPIVRTLVNIVVDSNEQNESIN